VTLPFSDSQATGPDLNIWEHKGVIGVPKNLSQAMSLSDTGRALKLDSGWYMPVGTRGYANRGGGVHWFRADDDSFAHITEKSFLFTTDPTGPLMECPDVFALGDKLVVLLSQPGVPVNTEGTSHWWTGTLSKDDLAFTAEATGRWDYGLPGFSSMYAAKSGTSALAPFTRRVLFGFSGWRAGQMSSCGGKYVLPREMSLSSTGTLLQHPVKETEGLRKGAAATGPGLAAGGQIEVLVRCKLPTKPLNSGILAVNTMQAPGQMVQVGYNFACSPHGACGFATVPAILGHNGSRTDQAPLQNAMQGDMVELHVFVDGQMIESFFNGETTITTNTNNMVGTSNLTSSFVNTAKLDCTVSSWVLGL
jgi:sucrose-6-phosphate hydrolase SacC (GH32 family)